MNAVFAEIVNMSITASVIIVAVLLFRLIFKRIPKWIYGIMWAMVAIRLIIPFSFESKLSLVPNVQKINSTSYAPTTYVNTNGTSYHGVNIYAILGFVWVLGVVAMIAYMFVSYLRLRKKVKESVKANNVWYCDHISSPFVLGFIKPKIYLSSNTSQTENNYVIAHEQAHIKRLDYIWKPLGFIILSIHWFNPLCWVAYLLFNKDIELACDEKVIKTLDLKGKKEYSTALLSCSAPRRMVSACPLAFGEASVKQRIKSVLSYKKPTLYIIIVAIVACVLIAVLFMTNPISNENEAPKSTTQSTTVPTEPTTVPTTEPTEVPTTEPVTEPPSTKPVTEPQTEAPTEEEVVEEYYDDSYYEEEYYEDNYYEEEYYDDSYSEENKDTNDSPYVPITPFEPDYDKYFGYYDYVDYDGSNFGLSNSQTNRYPNAFNEPVAWDPHGV